MFDCIVSLTSWTKRINNPILLEVLDSVVKQETKYNFHIVFVLSLEEFPKREDNLPQALVTFIKNNGIELLWTKENLKAYKKLYPVQKKYPELPIMTMDDDIVLEPTCIETFMDEHRNNPKCILSEGGRIFSPDGETLTGIFRLYPPHSVLEVDPLYFKYWFQNCEDDAYLAILAWAKDTQTKILKTQLAKEIKNTELTISALRNQYRKIDNKLCKIHLLQALKRMGILKKSIEPIIERFKNELLEKERQRKLREERLKELRLKREKEKEQRLKEINAVPEKLKRLQVVKPISVQNRYRRLRQNAK